MAYTLHGGDAHGQARAAIGATAGCPFGGDTAVATPFFGKEKGGPHVPFLPVIQETVTVFYERRGGNSLYGLSA